MRQGELAGMPEPAALRLLAADGQVLVTHGRTLVYRYEADDTGMRNLAIVALTDAGRRIDEVALLFGLTATYVSMLRGRARQGGSAALVRHRRGRPPKAHRPPGRPGPGVGRVGVDPAGHRRPAEGGPLGDQRAPRPGRPGPRTGRPDPDRQHRHRVRVPGNGGRPGCHHRGHVRHRAGGDGAGGDGAGGDGAGGGRVHRDAGWFGPGHGRRVPVPLRRRDAMLLYPYLHQVGAEDVFATLTGAPARRYNDLAVLTTATVGFALGVDTVEGTKQLRRADAGAAVGLGVAPQLATLRARLSALADGSDPLALQRAFAAGM